MSKLSDIARPGVFSVQHIEDLGEETIRLKRLGICENRLLEILQTGDPMILQVVGTRIGVSRKLGRSVTVSAAVPRLESNVEAVVGTRTIGTA